MVIHYTTVMVYIAHCLRYISCTRRFKNLLYSCLRAIGSHYTNMFLLFLIFSRIGSGRDQT
jgi:hypothetical protein